MITCGKRKTKRPSKRVPFNIGDLDHVASALTKKYSYSVYPHERDDLKQTIWYLILIARTKYDPQRGIPFEAWAYYYSRMKLKDHFWSGANLPGTKGTFSLLHTKAYELVELD